MNQDELTKMITSTIELIITDKWRPSYDWIDYKNQPTTYNGFQYEHELSYHRNDIQRIFLTQNIIVKSLSTFCDKSVIINKKQHYFDGLFVKTLEYLAKEITEAFMKTLEEWETLRFCKIIAQFTEPQHHETKKLTASTFGYLNLGECCVCYENTTIKTRCGHHLCYDCWGTLNKKRCPMCRDNIKNETTEYCECEDCQPYEEDDE